MLRRLFPNLATLAAGELMVLPVAALAVIGFAYGAADRLIRWSWMGL